MKKTITIIVMMLLVKLTIGQFLPSKMNAIAFKINDVVTTPKDTDLTVFNGGCIIVFNDGKKELIGIDKGLGLENLMFMGYIKSIKKKGHWRKIPGDLYSYIDVQNKEKNMFLIVNQDEGIMDGNGEASYVFVLYFEDGVSILFFTEITKTFPKEVKND
jgi:hypothetical protein